MRRRTALALLTAVGAFSGALAHESILFDTDMVTDFDDAGALAILHAMADAGEADILAIGVCAPWDGGVAAAETINAYYGRREIPVGVVKPPYPKSLDAEGKKGRPAYLDFRKDYPHWARHLTAAAAPDATAVYRRALAGAADRSVTVCSVGFTTNLRKLWESPPDDISPLTGAALVAAKVKCWYAMACRHPDGREYNSATDAEASRILFEKWPSPIVFSDFQYGENLHTGRALAESAVGGNPVKDVYVKCLGSRADAKLAQWRDQAAGHASWDLATVLAAVRGTDRYFGVQRGRYAMTDAQGNDKWTDDPNGPHVRLTEKLPKAKVGRVIDELMCRPPRLVPPPCDPVPVKKPVKTVRREIKVSVIGADRPRGPADVWQATAESCFAYWKGWMDREIANRPDLVVLPEGVESYLGYGPEKMRTVARNFGDRLLKLFQAYAKEHACYLSFNAHRQRSDGKFANTSFFLDREGDVIAVYDKVYPTPGEIEWKDFPIVPGKAPVVVDTDFGRVGFVTCFDLNFRDLLEAYAREKPDVLCFQSAYDGDFWRRVWSYTCRAYLIGCTVGGLAKEIDGPSGEILMHSHTYFYTSTTKINTNFRVIHLDDNWGGIQRAIDKYGDRFEMRNPGAVGAVTVLSHDPSRPIDDIVREFGLILWDDYYARSVRMRGGLVK